MLDEGREALDPVAVVGVQHAVDVAHLRVVDVAADHAEMRDIDGILYANDGDWVESLTALVEHADGRLEILDWSSRLPGRSVPAVAVAA